MVRRTHKPLHLLVYSYFAPLDRNLLGGAQRILDGLIRGLDKRGVPLTVVCPPAKNEQLISHASPSTTIYDGLLAVDRPDATTEELAHDLCVLRELSEGADVIVSIDRHYPLRTPN